MGRVRRSFLITALIVILLEEPSSAKAFSGYKCIVNNSYELSSRGLTPHRLSDLYQGREFVVDRETGRMMGFFPSAAWTGGSRVLDIGSSAQSFKAVYLSGGPYRHVLLLQVQEYAQGHAKPFMLLDDTDTVTGTCTHLR